MPSSDTSLSASDTSLLDLADRVGAAARVRGVWIGTVESCTGGLVAHLLTEIPGSSDYLRGGLVTYANEAKEELADVPGATLAAHGAVSSEVAVAMAVGGRRRLGVDVAVATTGVAGPSGGSVEKPVGLTYIAVADESGAIARRFIWDGDRSTNKRLSAEAALTLLLETLTAAPDEGSR